MRRKKHWKKNQKQNERNGNKNTQRMLIKKHFLWLRFVFFFIPSFPLFLRQWDLVFLLFLFCFVVFVVSLAHIFSLIHRSIFFPLFFIFPPSVLFFVCCFQRSKENNPFVDNDGKKEKKMLESFSFAFFSPFLINIIFPKKNN